MSLKEAGELERDRRLIERSLRVGKASRKEVDAFLGSLPDVGKKSVELDEVKLLAEAREGTAIRRQQIAVEEAARRGEIMGDAAEE